MQSGADAPPSPEMGTYRSAEAESQGGRQIEGFSAALREEMFSTSAVK